MTRAELNKIGVADNQSARRNGSLRYNGKFAAKKRVLPGSLVSWGYRLPRPFGNKNRTDTARDVIPPLAVIKRSEDDHITTVTFSANTKDPLTPQFATLSLHYQYTLKFDTCLGKLTIEGTRGLFPAYDLTVKGKITVNYLPGGISNNPLGLFLPRASVKPEPVKIKTYP